MKSISRRYPAVKNNPLEKRLSKGKWTSKEDPKKGFPTKKPH